MTSREDPPSSNQAEDDGESTIPRTELLSSKFLRKTKFQRKSFPTADQPEEAPSGEQVEGEQAEVETLDLGIKEEPKPVVKTGPPAVIVATDESQPLPLPASNTAPGKAVTDPPSSPPAAPEKYGKSTALSFTTLRDASPLPSATSPPTTDESMASSPRPSSSDKPGPDASASASDILYLPLSPEELDQAKSLVLDLLGWGVAPEYLVDSGVSPEALFRIFMDLNLRLPSNLVLSEESKAVAYSWGPLPSEWQPGKLRSMESI